MILLVQLPAAMLSTVLSLAPPTGDWIPASINGDCNATDVHFSDSLHGFATCFSDKGMVTDDGGLNWTVFPTHLQQSLVFAFHAGGDVLYAARNGLFKSDDRGQSWNEIGGLSSNFGSVLDVHFKADGNLVAIQGPELRFSDNGGTNWESAFSLEYPMAVHELHFPNGQEPSDSVGYATGGATSAAFSEGSVLRTIDGGHHWTPLAFPNGHIMAATFFDADSGVVATLFGNIYTTADSGASWESAGALPDKAILMDLVHRGPKHWIGVSLQGCLYETTDAGGVWKTAYCDSKNRGLIALAHSGGALVAVGNDGLVLYENRVFADGFD